jgi:hypothetical protein
MVGGGNVPIMSFSLVLCGTRRIRSGMGCRFMTRAPRPALPGVVRLDTVEADEIRLPEEELLPELLVATLRGTMLELLTLVEGVFLG